MTSKTRRILWLLNHKTLIPFEIPILRSLGFEVYIPKIIPNAAVMRSSTVTYSYDSSLTIPDDALRLLNSFDFYNQPWTNDVTQVINYYFGTAFTIGMYYPFNEVLTKFTGQVVWRVFGMQNTATYGSLLHYIFGNRMYKLLESVKDRLWFGQSYTQINECELPYFQNRSIYLPVGLDHSYWTNANSWHGSGKYILFVCSNINDNNPYYNTIYKNFKSKFGHLPHYIVGHQHNPVDDPHVLANISDEELVQLYQGCTVFYYHSREYRHLHYSPIEASIIGAPVVFYRDNLLGRMINAEVAGSAQNEVAAVDLIQRLLSGDDILSSIIRREQRLIPDLFSEGHCKPIWEQQLLSGPFSQALQESVKNMIYLPTANSVLSPVNWVDSIKLQEGLITSGNASYSILFNRAQIFLDGQRPGDTVLDIGGGDGYYAFSAEEKGASKVDFMLFGNSTGFQCVKVLKGSRVELKSKEDLVVPSWAGEGYDLVLLRDILNQTRYPVLLLEQVAALTKHRLVIETIYDGQDQARPTMIYYSGDRGGYPKDGFGFNIPFLSTILKKLGFTRLFSMPTPDAPTVRAIIIADKY